MKRTLILFLKLFFNRISLSSTDFYLVERYHRRIIPFRRVQVKTFTTSRLRFSIRYSIKILSFCWDWIIELPHSTFWRQFFLWTVYMIFCQLNAVICRERIWLMKDHRSSKFLHSLYDLLCSIIVLSFDQFFLLFLKHNQSWQMSLKLLDIFFDIFHIVKTILFNSVSFNLL